MQLNQIIVGCTDYAASVAFYRALGLRLIVDSPPRYARFETPTGETLSIHHVERVGEPTTTVYFEVEALDETVASLAAQGIAFDSGPEDQDWGWREAHLRDPAGNPLCLFWAGEYRRFPPWRIPDQEKESVQ